MFNTKTAVISNNEGGTYMPAGINENVYLKEVNVKKSPTGLDFLEIVFENAEGQVASTTEWKNNKGQFIKTDDDLQRQIIDSLVVYFRFLIVFIQNAKM